MWDTHSDWLLGTSTGGLEFLSLLLAVCIVNQVVLTPSSHRGHTVWISGCGKNDLILDVPREDSFLALFALFLLVFRWDAIHVPSLFAVAVSRNVSGLSGSIHLVGWTRGFCAIMRQAVIWCKAFSLVVCSDLVWPWTSLFWASQRSRNHLRDTSTTAGPQLYASYSVPNPL